MKKITYALLLLTFVFGACGNDKTKISTTEKNDDGTITKTEVDVKGMNNAADEMEQKMDALKKLKPLTIEQLKALLPEEIDEVKQSNYNASATMGYTYASADYKKDQEKGLEIQLFDCAGEMGAMYYSTAFMAGMNFQQENENEYTKTIDFNGGRAIENHRKEQNHTTLTYIVNDRLMVVLQGNNLSPEELKAVAKKLDFKVS